jgi:hypothetical protein
MHFNHYILKIVLLLNFVKQPWRWQNSNETCTVKKSTAKNRLSCVICLTVWSNVPVRQFTLCVWRQYRRKYNNWAALMTRRVRVVSSWVSALTLPHLQNYSFPYSVPICNYYQLLQNRKRLLSRKQSSSTLKDYVEQTVAIYLFFDLLISLFHLFSSTFFFPVREEEFISPNFLSTFVSMLLFLLGCKYE